jgi:hypothetical protein
MVARPWSDSEKCVKMGERDTLSSRATSVDVLR